MKSRIWTLQTASRSESDLSDSESPCESFIPRVKVKRIVESIESSPTIGSARQRYSSISDDFHRIINVNGASQPIRSGDANDLHNKGLFSDNSSSVSADSLTPFTPPIAPRIFDQADVPTFRRQNRPLSVISHSTPQDEPSIQNLIDGEDTPECPVKILTESWGAKAWEEDLAAGMTAKRVPPITTQSSLLDVKADLSTSIPLSQEGGDHLPSYAAAPIEFGEDDAIARLQARLSDLENRIVEMEDRKMEKIPVMSPNDMDLPQYLLIAGVGVCAIVGQAILKRIFVSKG